MFTPFYILLMTVATTLALFERNDEKKKNAIEQLVFFAFATLLLAIAAFRPVGIDQDSLNYVALFNGQGNQDIEIEPSFYMIVNACKMLTDDARILFIVYALLAIPIKAFGMTRASRMWMLSLVTWMGYYYIYQDFTQIRIAVSTGIFLFALTFHGNGQKSIALLLYLLAIFFHSTAALYLPLLLFGSKPLGLTAKSILSILPLLGIIINRLHIDPVMFLPIPQLQDRIELYEAMRDSGFMGDSINTFNIPFLFKLFIFYFILWKEKYITEKMPQLALYLKIFVYSICCFLVFSFMPVMAWRLSEVTGIIEIILFPAIVYVFREEIYGKLIVIAYAFMMVIQGLILTSNTINEGF